MSVTSPGLAVAPGWTLALGALPGHRTVSRGPLGSWHLACRGCAHSKAVPRARAHATAANPPVSSLRLGSEQRPGASWVPGPELVWQAGGTGHSPQPPPVPPEEVNGRVQAQGGRQVLPAGPGQGGAPGTWRAKLGFHPSTDGVDRGPVSGLSRGPGPTPQPAPQQGLHRLTRVCRRQGGRQ